MDRSEEKDRKSEETQGEESVSNDADGKSEYSADDIFRLRGVGDIKEIGNREIVIKDYAVLDGHTLKPKTNFSIDTPLLIKICYHRNEPKVKEMMCSIGIYRSDGILCYTTNSLIDNARTILVKDDGIIELLFEPIQLMQGQYSIDLSLNVDYGPTFHGILNAVNITIYNTRTDYGIFRPCVKWKI